MFVGKTKNNSLENSHLIRICQKIYGFIGVLALLDTKTCQLFCHHDIKTIEAAI